MSGHSKWASIKHKKGAADQARSKVFAKLIRQLEVTARDGGSSDPEVNASLRTVYQKARDASVPMDTIERAIKRGSGELEGVRYEPANYEGYAPGGVAVTDESEAKKVLRLLELIDDHDDVQAVHANYDIPDEVLSGFDG